jgi:aromatic amino acid aminotransferase I
LLAIPRPATSPYFWLQFQHYTPNLADRAAGHAKHPLPPPTGNPADDDIEAILKPFNAYAGVKSFLSRDIDGRVVRLDTFSKFFAPGSRCVSLIVPDQSSFAAS